MNDYTREMAKQMSEYIEAQVEARMKRFIENARGHDFAQSLTDALKLIQELEADNAQMKQKLNKINDVLAE